MDSLNDEEFDKFYGEEGVILEDKTKQKVTSPEELAELFNKRVEELTDEEVDEIIKRGIAEGGIVTDKVTQKKKKIDDLFSNMTVEEFEERAKKYGLLKEED